MFPSILIRTGVFRDRFAVNAILYVSQICLKKKILNSKAKNPMKIQWKFSETFFKNKIWKNFFLNLNSRKWSGIEYNGLFDSLEIFMSLKRARIFMEPYSYYISTMEWLSVVGRISKIPWDGNL